MPNELPKKTAEADFSYLQRSRTSFPRLYRTIPNFSHIAVWLATAKLFAVKTNSQAMASQGSKPATEAITATGEAAQPGASPLTPTVAADPGCSGATAARPMAKNPLRTASARIQAMANTPANKPFFDVYA